MTSRSKSISPSPFLPLAYLAASYAGMVTTFALVAAWSGRLATHYLLPDDLAVTHAATLGWITMAIMGAMYQFGPNGLHRPILSTKLGFAHFPLNAAGWPLMVVGFHSGRSEILITGGALAVAGIAAFVANVAPCVWRAAPSPTRAYLACSLVALVVASGVGFSFALNRHFTWFAVAPDRLAAHVGLGLVGWLTVTLMGVAYRMIPAHAIRERHREPVPRAVLILLLTSVALALLGGVMDVGRAWHGTEVAFASAGAWLFAARSVRRRVRLRRAWDEYEIQVACSLACLVGATVVTAAGVSGAFGGARSYTWPLAAGALLLGGWLGLAIVAQSYRIVPFLLWFHRYSRRTAGGAAPLLTDLYPVTLGRVASTLAVIAVVLITLGFVLVEKALLRAGGVLGATGAALHVVTLAHATWRSGSSRHRDAAIPVIELEPPGTLAFRR